MSSRAFRSVINRREHLERHQPAARARFGLLDKKKDYVQRAKAFHAKEDRLRALRGAAANRNPDEFYFKMLSTRTKGGVHAAESSRGRLTGDMLQVLRTQDKAYVSTVKGAEDRKVEKLQAALSGAPELRGAGLSKRTVFVDSEVEGAEALREAAARAGDEEAGAGGSAGGDAAAVRKAAKQARRAKGRAFAELDARMERQEKLGRLAQHMDLKRALLQKGQRVKVKEAAGELPAVFKWKAERKR